MKVKASDWRIISGLLDEALDLPVDSREAWLTELSPTYAPFRDTLKELLALHAAAKTADFLETISKGHLDAADRPEDAPDSRDEAVVGVYRIIRELGRGGMGTVWLAERIDGLLKRPVALKLPHSGLGNTRFAERLARERDILAGLAHPNIARLYDAGVTSSGQPYLALEYVEGVSLHAYCDGQHLDIAQRLRLFLQVLDAVQYAHSQLVIHRDLKPSNVLVTLDGQVRLLDFGIAKLVTDGEARETELTQLGGRALTPDYASPEQIAGKPIGIASDVYSLGVLLYELLSGIRPYKLKRESRGALEDAILGTEAIRPSSVPMDQAAALARSTTPKKLARTLRGDLDTIVLKALKKDPAARYSTIEAFGRDLRRFLAGEPVLARPDTAAYRLGKFVLRNRFGVGASCAIAIALISASALSLWQTRIAEREAHRALAIQGFLTDIFRTNSDTHPDPIKARQTTARELLDIGAKRIDENFKDDPEGQAEVLDMLGEMYFDVGLDPEAADFYRRRVLALKKVFGDHDARVAEALVTYGRQLEGLDRLAEQLAALNEAKAILDRNGDYSSEQRAQLLKSLSRAYSHSETKGLEYAEEATRIYRDYHPDGKGLPGTLVRLGYARMWVGDDRGSEAALREALALLERDPNASVSGTITAYLALAEVLAKQSKVVEAERNYRQALANTLARNGPVHEDTLHVEVRLGWFLHQTSRRDEGRRFLNSAFQKLNQGSYTPNVVTAVRTHFAYSLLAEGQLAAAEPMVLQMVETDRKAAAGGSLLLASSLRTQAELWILEGHYTEARDALEEAWVCVRKILGSDPDPAIVNSLLLTQAQLSVAQDAPHAAIAALDRIQPPRDAQYLALREYEVREEILRATAELQLNQSDEAQREAQLALDTIAASGLREYYQTLDADVLLRLGQVEAVRGALSLALEHLQRAVALRLANDDPKSPQLAEAEVAQATCLLGSGDRKGAERLIRTAHSRYAANPKLGEQFRSPLRLANTMLAKKI